MRTVSSCYMLTVITTKLSPSTKTPASLVRDNLLILVCFGKSFCLRCHNILILLANKGQKEIGFRLWRCLKHPRHHLVFRTSTKGPNCKFSMHVIKGPPFLAFDHFLTCQVALMTQIMLLRKMLVL